MPDTRQVVSWALGCGDKQASVFPVSFDACRSGDSGRLRGAPVARIRVAHSACSGRPECGQPGNCRPPQVKLEVTEARLLASRDLDGLGRGRW